MVPIMPFGNLVGGTSSKRQDHGLVAAGADEAHEICRLEARRGGILQRVTIDLGEVHEGFVDHHRNVPRAVVYERKRRDRTGLDAKHG